MASKIEELCDKVLAARAERDDLKSKLDACEKSVEAAETSLAKALDEGDGKCTQGGYSFSTTTKVSWKTLKESKDKLLGILKQGAPELVKESVNSASLAAFLRKNEQKLEEAGEAWWKKAKSHLERSESVSLSVRKASKKKA